MTGSVLRSKSQKIKRLVKNKLRCPNLKRAWQLTKRNSAALVYNSVKNEKNVLTYTNIHHAVKNTRCDENLFGKNHIIL